MFHEAATPVAALGPARRARSGYYRDRSVAVTVAAARIDNASTGTQSPSRWYTVVRDPSGTSTTITPRYMDGPQASCRPSASKAELTPDNPVCTAARPTSTACTATWPANCG